MSILLTENCIGCGACQFACVPKSIELKNDELGFIRAYISEANCTGCGRCKIVCPQLRTDRFCPSNYIAYQNPSKIDLELAQSGGAFSALASSVIKNKGYVIGVVWTANCNSVAFTVVNNLKELKPLHGSKYIMANLSLIIPTISKLVKENKFVMFCGLPCQVAAIRNLFRHNKNLLLVDFPCYGPISPIIWKHWRKLALPNKIDQYSFRDKRKNGWINACPSYTINSKTIFLNPATSWLQRIFRKGYAQNHSCLNCKYRSITRASDITMGDFWGIEKIFPSINHNNGISIVHINSDVGQLWSGCFKEGTIAYFEDFSFIREHNGGYSTSKIKSNKQKLFRLLCRILKPNIVVTIGTALQIFRIPFPK